MKSEKHRKYLLPAAAAVLLLAALVRRRRIAAALRAQRAQERTVRELEHHQRLEMIGTMTAGIAHEFNNLLTPIMGYSILTMEALPPEYGEQIDHLAEIYDASHRAKMLIARLSTLSRRDGGAAERPLSPDGLAERVLELARPALPPRVEVVRTLHCPEECLSGDETQLGQLLLNLIVNAFQAMEGRGGTLTVSTARSGDSVVFRVRDTGPGIPQEVLPQVFEPFFTTKEAGRGTGLGLAIAHRIAEEHHGRIEAANPPGGGAEFTVILPVRTEP